MAAATATASSSSSAPNPWDEEIVPALRKRLEAESQRLGKRMSRMLADEAIHPLGPIVVKDPSAEGVPPRTRGKVSTASSRTQGSLRSASGPAPAPSGVAPATTRWDDEQGEPTLNGSGTRATNIEQARERARRLRQGKDSASSSSLVGGDGAFVASSTSKASQQQRLRSRQVSEAQQGGLSSSSGGSWANADEWEGFYEPTRSKTGGLSGASRSRTVSTPLKPSNMATRRREERQRMEKENQELFGSLDDINGGEVAQDSEASLTPRKKRTQYIAGQEEHQQQGEAWTNGSSAKVRRSTSQSILEPSSSSSRMGSGTVEALTMDSAWAPKDALHTPRKQQQQQQQQLLPPVASPGFQSASAPVSPQAQHSRSTAARRERQGVCTVDQQLKEQDEFGPLGGTPRRQRSRYLPSPQDQEADEGAAGEMSMQSNKTHTSSAWDEELIPTVARRLQQKQLLAVASSSGDAVDKGNEKKDVLIDTWDRKGLPLSASEMARKKREREREEAEESRVKEEGRRMEEKEREKEKERIARKTQLDESDQYGQDGDAFNSTNSQNLHREQQKQHQQQHQGQQGQDEWPNSPHHQESRRHAAAMLGNSRFDTSASDEGHGKAKRGKGQGQEEEGAGCCKCNIM